MWCVVEVVIKRSARCVDINADRNVPVISFPFWVELGAGLLLPVIGAKTLLADERLSTPYRFQMRCSGVHIFRKTIL
jgi:hypothetical protein